MLGCTEDLECYTEVQPSYTKEHRIDLRSAPRQIFDYTARLETNRKLAVAQALAKQNSGGEIYVPVWPEEYRYFGTVSSADGAITMDTRFADWRVGSFALIMQNWETYAVKEISVVTTGLLDLVGTIGQQLVNPSIIPLRTALVTSGYSFERQATYADVNANFLVQDNIDLVDLYVSSYPTYNDLDVITDRPVLLEPVSESIIRPMEFRDNGFGPVAVQWAQNYSNLGQTASFYVPKGQRLWEKRLWAHSLRGKQKTFYLPSFNYDLDLQDVIDPGDTTILIKSIGPTGYYLNKSLMIWLKDGTRYMRGITNAANLGANDSLTISSALGATVNIADVKMICFIRLTRSDSDSLRFDHRLMTGATLSFPTMEVPE